MTIAAFKIEGMDCAEEVKALKAELSTRPGVQELAFDVLNGKMTVTFSPASVTPDDLIAAVSRTGMKANLWHDASLRIHESGGWKRWGRTLTMTASGLLIAAAFVTDALLRGPLAALGGRAESAAPLVVRLLYLAAVVAGAWFVAPKGGRALLRLRPDMNLLMTVAVIGAVGVGEYFEAATVAFLFAVSLALEAWSVGRARRAIAALMELSPPKARIICPHDRCEEMVPVERVAVGTTVIVKPGEKFPLDGQVAKGETTVNQAPITGESMPVPKRVGDAVFAGTINEDGAVEIVTTKPAQDTTLAHIIKMVGDAQSKRSPSEQWVEKFAHYYTPAVMCLAVAVMILPPLFGGAWSKWFYEGLVLLVIGCPCALVISTPVSIVAAMATAARHGVLVKGGPYMELPAHLKAVALDKTGTLTQGHPEVRQVVALSGHSELELLEIAAAIESRSEHPLARAILRFAEVQGVRATPAEGFQAIKGKGATARLNGKDIWIGSHRYLEERGQETPELHKQLEAWAGEGTSAVVIGENGHVCGLIAVADAIRPNARAAVADLKAVGIRHVAMLTGDNKATGEAVGRAAGVDEVCAELLPEDKVAAVEALVAKYGHVAMVGDGVNDAPAMARASLGIAMGAIGTDAALETADIALMSDDLSKLGWLIHHSRRTLVIIRQNIATALLVKAAFVLLTFAGHASLWSAIMADMGVSMLVVFNALRLLGDYRAQDSDSQAGIRNA